MTEQPGQDIWDRIARLGQLGKGWLRQIRLTLSLEKIERKGWAEHDSKDRTAGKGQPGQDNCGMTVMTR
jgi:hypothetical protein